MNAYILAGGKSRRFGTDKALFKLFGEPLVLTLHKRLSKYFPTFVVAKDLNKFRRLGIDNVIPDRFLEIQTPAVGILTALQHSEFERNLIVSVDLPLLCENYLRFVKNFKYPPGFYGYVPLSGGKKHYTAAIYSKSFSRPLSEAIKGGKYSLKAFDGNFFIFEEDLLKKYGVEENCFFNLNYRSQLSELPMKE
jgi:molybdopterin-guanine dinucleotide biosynthesis protein A